MIYLFLKSKGKLNFIKSLIHAFQTRINSLSFHFCHPFDSVIMEEQFCDLFSIVGSWLYTAGSWYVWKESCPQCIVGIGGTVSLPVTEYQKRHKAHPAPPFTCHSYKSSRHTHFIRDQLNSSNNPFRWNWQIPGYHYEIIQKRKVQFYIKLFHLFLLCVYSYILSS